MDKVDIQAGICIIFGIQRKSLSTTNNYVDNHFFEILDERQLEYIFNLAE